VDAQLHQALDAGLDVWADEQNEVVNSKTGKKA
jgi:hypothetical protein